MKYEKYKLNELAKIEKVKGKPLSKYKEGETPYVTGSQSNNGVVGYINAPKKDISKGNCIVVDPIKGLCMYQENDFVGRGFSGASINALYIEGMDETSAMFIIAAIKKVSLKVASYSYLFNSNKLAEAEIMLPTLDALDVNSPYSSNGYVPDWKYMKDRVAELEKDRVAELENYLIASGLNDYKLTEEDKSVLAAKLVDGGALSQNSISTDGCLKEGRKFKIDDLFKKEKLGWITNRKFNKEKDVSKEQTKEFDLPLVNAKDGNNGIMYYGRSSDFSSVDGGIDIVSNGAISTGNVYPQSHKIGVLFDAYIVNLKNGMKNECLLMYLAASIQKSIKPRFGYSNKAVWSKVRKCNICLPIQTDDSGKPVIDAGKTYSPKGYIPDWEYMEKYIKATEKEIIKEVVLYKDEVIAKAKEITGEKEVAW